MNRAEFAYDLLRKMGTVTNGYVADHHRDMVFTWRNAVSEAKSILPKGYMIRANIKGRNWRDHSYTLEYVGTKETQMEMAV